MKSFTIVIPIYNEAQNIQNLLKEITLFLSEVHSYEIIIVDDGSQDLEPNMIAKLENMFSFVKLCNHTKNLGQSKAIFTGVTKAKYDTIITIDGDGQNNPKDILKLINLYYNNNCQLVGGLRVNRQDSVIKKISSKIANKIRQSILKDECSDTGCSLKIFSKKVYLKLPYFNGNHRFLPALFKGYGYIAKFVPVDHRKRTRGISKYGTLDRLFKGLRDLIHVRNLIKKHRND
ncbi:glycosyltransferase [Alphaproteobacteria bacterium]|nr:glycosyltransferase [Alphaproteobacteria bacterium]